MRYKALMAGAALLTAIPAHAEDWDFILVNETGKEIKTIEVSPAGTATWQPNKIDTEVRANTAIKAGARTTIHFNKETQCRYDLKATYADDTNAVWTNMNVCDSFSFTIRLNNGTPVVVANR